MRTRVLALAAAAAAACPLIAAAAAADPAAASAHPSFTAKTLVTDHADTGQGGKWATDDYTITARLTRNGQVADSKCETKTRPKVRWCWAWTARLDLAGQFTTIPGAKAPGGPKGTKLGEQLTGTFHGWVRAIHFVSTWKHAYPGDLPKLVDDHGTKGSGRATIAGWPELFFGGMSSNATFGPGIQLGGTGGAQYWFGYRYGFGTDPACKVASFKWIDSVPWQDDGAAPTAGTILAPDSANCI